MQALTMMTLMNNADRRKPKLSLDIPLINREPADKDFFNTIGNTPRPQGSTPLFFDTFSPLSISISSNIPSDNPSPNVSSSTYSDDTELDGLYYDMGKLAIGDELDRLNLDDDRLSVYSWHTVDDVIPEGTKTDLDSDNRKIIVRPDRSALWMLIRPHSR